MNKTQKHTIALAFFVMCLITKFCMSSDELLKHCFINKTNDKICLSLLNDEQKSTNQFELSPGKNATTKQAPSYIGIKGVYNPLSPPHVIDTRKTQDELSKKDNNYHQIHQVNWHINSACKTWNVRATRKNPH